VLAATTALVARKDFPEALVPIRAREVLQAEPTPDKQLVGEDHGTTSKRSDHGARLRGVQHG
jgi:hypothetical protein